MTGWVWWAAEVVAALSIGLSVAVAAIYLRLRRHSTGFLPRALSVASLLLAAQSVGLLVTYWFLSGHYGAMVATPLLGVNVLEIGALVVFLRIAMV